MTYIPSSQILGPAPAGRLICRQWPTVKAVFAETRLRPDEEVRLAFGFHLWVLLDLQGGEIKVGDNFFDQGGNFEAVAFRVRSRGGLIVKADQASHLRHLSLQFRQTPPDSGDDHQPIDSSMRRLLEVLMDECEGEIIVGVVWIMIADPNNQSIIAFAVITVLVLIGLAAKVMLGRSKVTKDRTGATGDLFPLDGRHCAVY